MISKQTLILGIIFVILLGLAFAYKPFLEWREKRGEPDNFFAKINFDDINKIEINGDEDVILVREGDKWRIDGTKDFYLNSGRADSIKNAFKDARESSLEIVSENKDKKGQFLTNEEGVGVKFYKNNKLALDFIVGKTGNDFTSTYVSREGIDKTYLVKANLYNAFSHNDWYDKTIFSASKDKINKIRMQYPDHEFTMEKVKNGDKEEWQGTLPYKFKVSEEKVNKILNIMTSLRATRIPEQKFEGTGLEKHLIIVEASGDDVDNILMVGDAYKDGEEELYYAKKGDSDNIYLITKEQRDELNKTIRDLR